MWRFPNGEYFDLETKSGFLYQRCLFIEEDEHIVVLKHEAIVGTRVFIQLDKDDIMLIRTPVSAGVPQRPSESRVDG